VGSFVALGPLRVLADEREPSRAPVLVEDPSCAHPSPATTPRPPAPSGGSTQVITVTVPATALLRIDAHDRIVAALTNTGCAPRSTDSIYLIRPDGSVTPTREVSVDRAWTGNFTAAGVWVAQRPMPERGDD
jgi:hypothetical protein